MSAYKTYSDFLAEKFPQYRKIQKIGVTTGHSCPNRDGTIGTGGCAYCNNSSFTPGYVTSRSGGDIVRTLDEGKAFFARKYPEMKYLAYFQSYTNTHGADATTLVDLYRKAASVKDVVGVVIGTRPDCLPETLLSQLAAINRNEFPVLMEFGAESSHDSTLERVNRCHTWQTTTDAVMRCARHDLSVGLHFIMGLPGETTEMMLDTVRRAAELPVDTLKFHQLQIIRGTRFEKEYLADSGRFNLFPPEKYADLCCRIIEIVGPTGIAIERFVSQAPDKLLVAPRWGLKNYQFVNLLSNRLKMRGKQIGTNIRY